MIKHFASLHDAVHFMNSLTVFGKTSQVSFCQIIGMYEVEW